MTDDPGTRSIGKSQFFRAEWRDGIDVDRWVRRMSKGKVLVFPCGHSTFGDVMADADPEVNPDVLADIENPPFEPKSFDTIYVDPPYSLCAYDKILVWLKKVWAAARHRLILNSTPVNAYLPNSNLEIYHERRGGSPHLPTFHVWTRTDSDLFDFQP